jgi:glycosyltransferase involved in cell wall biosynthesis
MRTAGSRPSFPDITAPPRRALRVCHVAYTFYELDNRVMRYVQALANRGDHVDVIALRREGRSWRETSGRTTLYQVQRRSPTEQNPLTYLLKLLWFFLKASAVLSTLQVRHRYDVVHVHNVPDFLVFVAWLPKLMGARIVLDIHDILPELYAGKFRVAPGSRVFRWLLAVERGCCRFADHVIVANHLWQDRLIARAVRPERCTAIMNYPDLTLFGPRQEAASTGAPFRILYPGSLNHHQGVDIAVRAFALVAADMPGAEFHIYGRGPDLAMLKALGQELGLGARLRFMDNVGMTEIGALMARASVGVVPKRADGFGNEAFSTKIFEFMACGVPLIVSRTRVDEHYFDDALVNFFDGTAEDLARALVRVYRHPEEQVERVRNAEAMATRYSWQCRSGEYKSLVDGLVDAPVRTAAAAAAGSR